MGDNLLDYYGRTHIEFNPSLLWLGKDTAFVFVFDILSYFKYLLTDRDFLFSNFISFLNLYRHYILIYFLILNLCILMYCIKPELFGLLYVVRSSLNPTVQIFHFFHWLENSLKIVCYDNTTSNIISEIVKMFIILSLVRKSHSRCSLILFRLDNQSRPAPSYLSCLLP